MDGVVLFGEGGFEGEAPTAVQEAETSGDESVVAQEGAFLGAALDDHVDEFYFFAVGYFDAG